MSAVRERISGIEGEVTTGFAWAGDTQTDSVCTLSFFAVVISLVLYRKLNVPAEIREPVLPFPVENYWFVVRI